jgi:hypothetical protein
VSELLEHVLRSLPPWRSGAETECGHDAAEFAPDRLITRDQFAAKVRQQGKQRSAMTTCMTCWHTAIRHHDWAHSPSSVLAREVNKATYWRDGEDEPLIDRELRAVAALIEAHRGEFDGYLGGLAETTSLTERRRMRRRAGS